MVLRLVHINVPHRGLVKLAVKRLVFKMSQGLEDMLLLFLLLKFSFKFGQHVALLERLLYVRDAFILPHKERLLASF
jgi:hypothetical protein